MKTRIGQLFFIGLNGPSLSADEKKIIVENNIGGVILFDRSIKSPEQLLELCQDLQNLKNEMPDKTPLFIGIDMEGGRVARLKSPFTEWPSLKQLAALDSTSVAFQFAQAMGEELMAAGINLNFAPCVDVLTNPQNELIGDRSLGKDPEHVAKVASAIVRGYIKAGVIPCAKHFPGHGNTVVDSHIELPIDSADKKMIEDQYLPPFKKVFRARLDFVMTAHVKYEGLDPEWPATLSEKILKGLIRDDLRFRNIVLTDDLDMGALAENYDKNFIPLQALKAGANMLMYCNNQENALNAIEVIEKAAANKELDALSLSNSYDLVMKVKKDKLESLAPISLVEAQKTIGKPEHKALAQAIASGDVPEEAKS